MEFRRAALVLLTLLVAQGATPRAAAQAARPLIAVQATPLPVPTPIVVPTLPPSDAATQAIIRAAAGIVNDVITRNRITAANSTHGTVTYFHRYDMQVRTGPNAYRSVRLRQGTVINPRGATPGTGTVVDITGQGAADGTLAADMITVVQ